MKQAEGRCPSAPPRSVSVKMKGETGGIDPGPFAL
ncbi:MAG: hypothetical protein RLZZ528_2427 [Pseudomonadota bacterium]